MSTQSFPWKHNRRFNSYSEYIKNLFGGRVQKVAVNAGFTCPNRDGSISSGGCSFCNNSGFNPSYCNPAKPITQQIKEGIEFHSARYRRAKQFLVYFQPFSNTYAPLDVLKEKYSEALAYPDVAGLVIGTRPDCIDQKKIDFLAELSKKHYIQIEFGVESHNDTTLKRINRGHDSEVAVNAIKKTHQAGICTGAHYIFGLPGETPEDMNATGKVISSLPLDTVKFHQLQIVRGTKVETEYKNQRSDFCTFSLETYIDFIIRFIESMSPSIVIERFTSEMPPAFLAGENMGLIRYDEVLRRIEAGLERRQTWQGKYYT